MTTFDRKINQIAVRHGWSIEKQPRAAVECYIIDAASSSRHGKAAHGKRPTEKGQQKKR